MRKALLGIVLSLWIGCGDDLAAPGGPDGGVPAEPDAATAMHPHNPPPARCVVGYHPTPDGCEPNADAGT